MELQELLSNTRVVPTGCMEWTGARTGSWPGDETGGYGVKAHKLAHRLAWEAANGPIPEGMLVCHHCDNPPCVNPDHLFLGTQIDNMRDMRAKGRGMAARMAARTHCPKGHPYDEANTIRRSQNWRGCRACGRLTSAQYRARVKKGAA